MCMKHPKKFLNMRLQDVANAANAAEERYGGNVGSSVQEGCSANLTQMHILDDVSDDETLAEEAILPQLKNARQQHRPHQSSYSDEVYDDNAENNENKPHQLDSSSVESFDISSTTEEYYNETKKILQSKWFRIGRLVLILLFIVFLIYWKALEAIHRLSESLEKLSKEPIDWNIYDNKGELVRVVHLDGVLR